MDGIDLATYYYCYCVHMICNHDLEWGGWKAGMGTKESIFEVGKMTLHVKYINPIMKQKPLSAKKKKQISVRIQAVKVRVCVWSIQSRHKLDCIHSKACSDECMGMQPCILLNVQEEGAIVSK